MANEKASSPEFLLQCLHCSGLDEDLVADTLDACEIAELDALKLAGGKLSQDTIAERLFLTQEEASRLMEACRKQCLALGVDFGDDGVRLQPSASLAEPGECDQPWTSEFRPLRRSFLKRALAPISCSNTRSESARARQAGTNS